MAFGTTGIIGGRAFATSVAVRLAVFGVASFLVLPLLVQLYVGTAGCEYELCTTAHEGLAGDLLKAILSVILILSLIGISVRRARDAGLPPWVGLIVPAAVMNLSDFLMVYHAPSLVLPDGVFWGNGRQPLDSTLLLLTSIIALTMLPPRDRVQAVPFGVAGKLATALGAIVAARASIITFALLADAIWPPFIRSAALIGIRIHTRLLSNPWSILHEISRTFIPLTATAGMLLSVIIVLFLVRERKNRPAWPDRLVLPSWLPHPAVSATLLVIAIWAVFNLHTFRGQPVTWGLWFTYSYQVSVLHTFAVYLALATGIGYAIKRRGRGISIIVALLPMVPFSFAAVGYANAAAALEAREAGYAALQALPASQMPPAAVLRSTEGDRLDMLLWRIPGIERVLRVGPDLTNPVEMLQPDESRRSITGEPAALPPSYLLFESEALSEPAGVAFELAIISDGTKQPVAAWSHLTALFPVFPPVFNSIVPIHVDPIRSVPYWTAATAFLEKTIEGGLTPDAPR